ncbi:MAG: ATP-binding protein [Bacteroidota bacterium]
MTSNLDIILGTNRKRLGELREIEFLRSRLIETEEALVAIRTGEVDTLLVSGKKGVHLYTLKGADHSYRILLEGLNEAALTLTPKGTILYCNKQFSAMTKTPHSHLLGSSILHIIRPDERKEFGETVHESARSPVRKEFTIQGSDRSHLPALFSMKTIPIGGATAICAVVTDITDRKLAEGALEKSKGHYQELFLEGQRMQDELHRLSQEILRTQEKERARISREIHDEIGQVLTALGLNLNELQRNGKPSVVKEKIRAMQSLVRQGSDFVHHFSHQIHPTMMDHLGLYPTIRSYVREFQKNTGMRVRLNLSGQTGGATIEVQVAIFRIVQESLTNVLKHSGVRTATVTIRKSKEAIIMQIADAGKGFRVDRSSQSNAKRGGLGLLGMRERVRSLGGKFTILSHPGRGTKVRVRIQFARGGGQTMKGSQNGNDKNSPR